MFKYIPPHFREEGFTDLLRLVPGTVEHKIATLEYTVERLKVDRNIAVPDCPVNRNKQGCAVCGFKSLGFKFV